MSFLSFVLQSINTEYLFSGTEEANSALAIVIMIFGIFLFGFYLTINTIIAEDRSEPDTEKGGDEDAADR